MSRVLPILFNTDMVQAVLDGRKTVTRRVIKPQPGKDMIYKLGYCVDGDKNVVGKFGFGSHECGGNILYVKPSYQPGDILYVRETWNFVYDMDDSDQIIEGTGKYYYAASDTLPFDTYVDSMGRTHEHIPWRPSIHMPKEAARIWLKVTDVRVERLQDIMDEQAEAEGIRGYSKDGNIYKYAVSDDWWIEFHRKHGKLFTGSWWQDMPRTASEAFLYLWNSTLKKSDLDRYGWDANPWVWVIEFERCEKPEN